MAVRVAWPTVDFRPVPTFLCVTGHVGWLAACVRIRLKLLSDICNCALIFFREIPAFLSSMAALFSSVEKF